MLIGNQWRVKTRTDRIARWYKEKCFASCGSARLKKVEVVQNNYVPFGRNNPVRHDLSDIIIVCLMINTANIGQSNV
jgi:hypothetical protein